MIHAEVVTHFVTLNAVAGSGNSILEDASSRGSQERRVSLLAYFLGPHCDCEYCNKNTQLIVAVPDKYLRFDVTILQLTDE